MKRDEEFDYLYFRLNKEDSRLLILYLKMTFDVFKNYSDNSYYVIQIGSFLDKNLDKYKSVFKENFAIKDEEEKFIESFENSILTKALRKEN